MKKNTEVSIKGSSLPLSLLVSESLGLAVTSLAAWPLIITYVCGCLVIFAFLILWWRKFEQQLAVKRRFIEWCFILSPWAWLACTVLIFSSYGQGHSKLKSGEPHRAAQESIGTPKMMQP